MTRCMRRIFLSHAPRVICGLPLSAIWAYALGCTHSFHAAATVGDSRHGTTTTMKKASTATGPLGAFVVWLASVCDDPSSLLPATELLKASNSALIRAFSSLSFAFSIAICISRPFDFPRSSLSRLVVRLPMSLFEPRGTASSGGPASASPRLSPWPEPLSPQQLREWFAQRTRLRSGAAGAGGSAAGGTGAGGARATSLGGAGVPAGAEGTGGAGAAGPGGACTRGTGASGAGGVGGARAGGAGAGDPGAGGPGAGGTGTGGTGAGGAGARGAGVGDPAAGDAGAGDPGACGAGAGGAGAGDTGAGGARAIDPGVGGAGIGGAVSGGTATVVTDPSFESTSASALVAELVDFAAACYLEYATSLVAESESD
ncbi:unnamed protein product [Closterium sp. NIES-54]